MKVNGLEFNVKVSGQGKSLIWGHGLTDSMALADQASWKDIDFKELARDARVVRYDARGHGQSEASFNPQEYHWSNLAEDMLAVADGLGIKNFIAGGQSMGCATAIYAGLAAPERIRALVLVIPPTAWETRAVRASAYDQMADVIEKEGTPVLVKVLQQLPVTPAWKQQVNPDGDVNYHQALLAFDTKTLAVIMRGAKLCNLPAREELRSLHMPTLILAWDGDPTHPVSTAEELAELLPDARLVVGRNPEEVATWTEHIQEFIAGI